MKRNHSPWLYQLKQDRESKKLDQDLETDVVIIGAGIAGVSTAFFVLKNTDKRVVLVDRFKLAHGATGHNAGQITSYFERGFASIAEEFGLQMAAEGQQAVEDAWGLLDEMYTDAGLNIPLSRFTGHAGLSTLEQVNFHLKNNYMRKRAGLNIETIRIAEDAPFASEISGQYAGLYTFVPHKDVLDLLETESPEYVASLSYQKGCANSALLCQEVVAFLASRYPDRFSFYEHTPIEKMILKPTGALLDAGEYEIMAGHVILCTNGFEGVTIINDGGLGINAKFHHMVHGTVGYMSGYLETMNKPPIAVSYFPQVAGLTDYDEESGDPYYYLTRRQYEYEGKRDANLISIGGPELRLEDASVYGSDNDYPDDIIGTIDGFVKKTYDLDPNKKIDYVFTWHGLMGYTRNGIRLIGPEPQNPVLMYNLGCNGVGILPSIYGGKRIAEILSGKELPPSIFDIPQS